ncbi:MAG: homoserine O-succinyltransferase [Kiloniellales bacterium]|nr:homoserine O-succinyltransferase [Kiloniellales bacterium]
MPIKIPNSLPAREALEDEGVVVMSESVAVRQDIRPLRIAMLNLMPRKETTETQWARLIGATPLQIDFTLVTTASYRPTNVSEKHMQDFYRPWQDVAKEKFDGFIITGAPIEKLEFEEVYYWSELEEILDWTQSHVHQTLDLCWGAQAALYHFHKVPKYLLPQKMFGVFDHNVLVSHSPLLRGFNDTFPVPVSRHTETRTEDLAGIEGITLLAHSPEAGLCMLEDRKHRHICMFNHLEYDARTLEDEYRRDLSQGLEITVPAHYYPDDNPNEAPSNVWRAHGHLFVSNWINGLYQTAPFDINRIGEADLNEGNPGKTESAAV